MALTLQAHPHRAQRTAATSSTQLLAVQLLAPAPAPHTPVAACRGNRRPRTGFTGAWRGSLKVDGPLSWTSAMCSPALRRDTMECTCACLLHMALGLQHFPQSQDPAALPGEHTNQFLEGGFSQPPPSPFLVAVGRTVTLISLFSSANGLVTRSRRTAVMQGDTLRQWLC